ncbi:MAG TPA: helix-turn-helix transcriptional regulator [Pantanalinema sp.]
MLAVLRAKKGRISQTELSRQTGITQKQLSALESGKTKGIEFSTLAKLCDFFGCTPNDLLAIEQEEPLTPAELAEADALIARSLARAMGQGAQSPEVIWERFELTRSRIAAEAEKVSEPGDRKRA